MIPIPSKHNHQDYFRRLNLQTNTFVVNVKEQICHLSDASKEVVLAAIAGYSISIANLDEAEKKLPRLSIFGPELRRLSKENDRWILEDRS